MIGYKKVLQNKVEIDVETYVEKKSGKFAYIDYDTVKLDLDNKDLGLPCFKLDISVEYRKYEIHGYIREYGDVVVTSVDFDRMECQKKDENGEWITESAKHVSHFVWGDELKEFKFDK